MKSKKEAKDLPEAVEKLLAAVEPLCSQLEQDVIRMRSAFFVEEVNHVYTKYKKVIKGIFQKYMKRMPGKKEFLSLASWQRMLQDVNAYDNDFTSREGPLAFRLGLQSCVDEV